MFASSPVLDVVALRGLIGSLAGLRQDVDDSVRIDRIRVLQELINAAAAAQVRETAAFAASQRHSQRAAGIPDERAGRGIAAQVGLARRVSPWHAQRYTGWAVVLTTELPETFAALQGGQLNEWRAMLVARETMFLSREDRGRVDAELAPRLESLGDRRVEAEAKKIAYRLDPEGFVARSRTAEAGRRVSLRPAPDAMARLTAVLPVAQGVACLRALQQAADTATAQDGTRGRGQVMADTLVERVTGQVQAAAVPVEIHLVMPADTLLGGRPEPAHLDGYGPLPAGAARALAGKGGAPVWLRRVFTRPESGDLIGMDSRRRLFTPAQQRFIRLRDQVCRTPWCGAPIRHTDHVRPFSEGGQTSARNGQGLCEACNHAKQAPGWQSRAPAGAHQEVIIRTPTGHRYRSRPPDPPGTRRHKSPVESELEKLLAA